MKNIPKILALALSLILAATSASAQDADSAYKNFKQLRDNKDAKPSVAVFQKMSKAGVDFLVAYPTDKRAPGVVNEMLSYGSTTITTKDKALRPAWYSQVKLELIGYVHESTTSKDAKAAIQALNTAMSEGSTMDALSGQAVSDWRDEIDKLAAIPGGTRYVLDREKGFFAMLSKVKSTPNIEQMKAAQLAALITSKDKNTAAWAKQETKIEALRRTPFTLSFTALDGKAFDSAKLKGAPALYLYFWRTDSKNADADLSKLMDAYYETGRKQVEFVGVCCDPEENRAAVLAFVKKNKLRFAMLFDGKGTNGKLADQFGITAVPIGYLFDGKGNLAPATVKPGDLKKLFP